MNSIFSPTFLSRQPITRAMHCFGKKFNADSKVLDIGCGTKPYASFFSCKYVGVDPLEIVKPDIVAPAWNIPVEDESFDGIVLNQSLEHIQKSKEAVTEIKRILKSGGYCIITAPHTMKNHSEPIPIGKTSYANKVKSEEVPYWQEDYYRFTKFGLLSLFEDFTVESIHETSGYCGTIVQLVNYFFASFGNIRWIFTPIYFLNNCLGYATDSLFKNLSYWNIPGFRKFYSLIYSALPLNYVLILKKP